MPDICDLTLKDLQPSQFYISERKLRGVNEWFRPEDLSNFEPIPVKMLDGIPVMTDGHTRAVAAVLAGLDKVPFVWDEDELQNALEEGDITKEQFDMAYETLKEMLSEIAMESNIYINNDHKTYIEEHFKI